MAIFTLTPNHDKKKGTTQADAISGLAGNDTLAGDAGTDTLQGGSGNDSLDGGTGNDRLLGDTGNDTLLGSAGNDFLEGGADNDRLDSGAGADTLDGGSGADTLIGGDGDDLYLVDNIGDKITEANKPTSGTADTVRSSIDFSLPDFLENLLLQGSSFLKATGNSLANRLTGNLGNNRLDGRAGDDTLQGGDGDDTLIGGTGKDRLEGGDGSDTYQISSTEDQIVETNSNGDQDQIESSTGYDLTRSPGVEALILTGTASLDGQGNALDNTLTGNGGSNLLQGRDGNDSLSGEVGDDSLEGGVGDDRLDGGDGQDRAVYGGVRDDYNIVQSDEADTWTVEHVSGDEGTDRLTGIETLLFADGVIDLADLAQGDLPQLSVQDISLTEGHSGSKLANFQFTLSKASPTPVSVNYTTVDVTATAGSDYTTQSGILTFAPKETRKSLSISILGDTGMEDNETFWLQLSNPNGVELPRIIATATLTNDDKPKVAISSLSTPEGNSGITQVQVMVNLSAPAAEPVSVQYSTMDFTAQANSDYTPAQGTLSFSPGEKSKPITLSIKGDTALEPNEIFKVMLSNPTGATLDDTAALANITITDDEIRQNTLTLSSDKTVFKAGDSAMLRLSFSAVPRGFDVNDVQVSGGALSGLTPDASGLNYTARFTPTPNTNRLAASISVPAASYQDVQGTPGAASNVLSFTGDTQAPGINLSANKTRLASGDLATINFNVSEIPTGFTRDDIRVTGGSLASLQQTDASGQLYTAQFTLSSATGSISVSNASYTDAAGNPGTASNTLNFSQEQPPMLSVAGATITEGDNGISNANITVSLSTASSNTVTVNYTTRDGTAIAGSDYQPSTGSLLFTPGQTRQTITIPIIGDTAVEPNETLTINLYNSVNATLLNGSASITLVNDDVVVTPTVDNETFMGTDGNDYLVGGEGDDDLSGYGGDDTFDGGDGWDQVVYLGNEADYNYYFDEDSQTWTVQDVNGTDGVDEGTDILINVEELDFADNTVRLKSVPTEVIPESGTILTLTDGNDKKSGTADNDKIDGLGGNDTIQGVDGNDTLIGNTGNDSLDGGVGNDLLDGGDGLDTLVGGDGNDLYIVENSRDVIIEASGSTSGIDSVKSSVTYTLPVNVENLTLTGMNNLNGTGNDSANNITGNDGDNVLDGKNGFDTLIGGDGDDTLMGSGGIDVLTGGDGSDTYRVSSNEDKIVETAKDGDRDVIESTASYSLGANIEVLTLIGAYAIQGTGNELDNIIDGSEVGNQLYGHEGNDTINGNGGDDTIHGGAGDDSIDGGDGQDQVVYGGTEADYKYYFDAYSQTWTVQDVNRTDGDGVDKGIDILTNVESLLFADKKVDLVGVTTPVLSVAGATITEGDNGVSNASITVSLSTASSNTVTVNYTTRDGTAIAGSDYQPSTGSLLFTPGQTRQTITIPIIGDTSVEPNETFTINLYNSVNATLLNGSASITLVNDDVVVTPTVDNQTFMGTDGDDYLNGGAGNDKLDGGNGNDTLDGGTGADTLIGGDGNDLYIVENSRDVIIEELGRTSGIDSVKSSVTYTLPVNVENLTLMGMNNLNGTGNDDANTIIGNDGNNVLNGGNGNDRLMGSNGDDTLMGGGGVDVLAGGDGSDTYRVSSIEDKILETFTDGDMDVIESTVNYTLVPNVEVLVLEGSLVVEGTGNELDNLLEGSEYGNSLYGRQGNDSINGNGGYDTIDGGAGDDIIDGGDGQDQVVYGGNEADYKYYFDGRSQTWAVQDVNGTYGDGVDEGTDILTNIESLIFADNTIDLIGVTTTNVAPQPPVLG